MELPDIVDGLSGLNKGVVPAFGSGQHLPALVHGEVNGVHDHPDGPVAGGQVLGAQVAQHVLREAQGKKMIPDGLRFLGPGGVSRLPVHGVTAAEAVAAEAAQGQDRCQSQRQPAVRQAHRGRAQDVASLLQRPGEPEEAPEQEDIARQHGDAPEPALPAQAGGETEGGIPGHDAQGGVGLGREPRPPLYRPQPLPEAEELGQQKAHLQHRQALGDCGHQHLGGIDGAGVQGQQGDAVSRLRRREDEAGPEPAVLPPEGPVAQEQQQRAQGGQKILQAEEAQRHGPEGAAGEDPVHGPAPGGDGAHDLLRGKVREAVRQQLFQLVPVVLTHGHPLLPAPSGGAGAPGRACPPPPAP